MPSKTPAKASKKQSRHVRQSEQNAGNPLSRHKDFFTVFASHTAHFSGSPITFCVAVSIILIWAVTGPLFQFSDTWQLVINTGTTIVTFLMVFLIQNTQNRDSEALHLKIDELIRANPKAKNQLLSLEDLSQDELDEIKGEFAKMAEAADDAGAALGTGVNSVGKKATAEKPPAKKSSDKRK